MQQANVSTGKRFNTKMMVSTAMMIALTVVMMFTPGIGRITLPIVSVTIAHVPILIAAVLLGIYPGLAVALAFGATSLFIALTSPATILDPFFVNPAISILPRLLIPVTAYFSYRGLDNLFGKTKAGNIAATAISVVVGNLTNTFGVYGMLYLIYAKEILEKTGTPALNLIITAMSTSTAIKCVAVVVLTVPIIVALKKALRYS